MREVTKNKKSSIKMLIVALAVLVAVSAFVVAMAVSDTGVTYADTASTTYNQLIYANTNIVSDTSFYGFKGKSWLKTQQNKYDDFEYVLGFTFEGLWDFGYSANGYYYEVFSDDLFLSFSLDSSYSFIFEYGYAFEDFPFSETIGGKTIDEYGSKSYFVITKDNVYLAIYKDIYDFEDSFNQCKYGRIVVEYSKDSFEYGFFEKMLLSSADDLVVHSGIEENPDYHISWEDRLFFEELYLYKEMEVPIKEGYTFTGWYYDKDCTLPYDGALIEDDVDLYAGWEINTYEVFFDGSDLVVDDPNNQGLYDWVAIVEYGGVAVYEGDNDPSKVDGATFSGWYFEDGTKYENTPIYQDTRLYGKWCCVVSFDLNGAEGSIEPIIVEYGAQLDLPILEREKYGFSRWYYWTEIDMGEFTNTVDVTFDEFSHVKGDMTLIADWYRNIFTVTFYVDDEIWKQVEVEYGKSLFDISKSAGVDVKAVVGFENMNTYTQATSFSKFVVEDDVSVYLSDEPANVSHSNSSSNAFVKFFVDLWAKIKSFFEKIGQWFKNLFSKK